MVQSPEYKKSTPGLSESWRYWRAIENASLQDAEKQYSVLDRLDTLDTETKAVVVKALEDLRKKETARKKSEPSIIAETIYQDSRSQRVKEKKRRGHVDYESESSTDNLVAAFNSILRLIKENKLEQALAKYVNLPHINDKARVLCSLISHKTSMGNNFSEDVSRKSITPLSLKLPPKQRTEIIGRFIEKYFKALSQSR